MRPGRNSFIFMVILGGIALLIPLIPILIWGLIFGGIAYVSIFVWEQILMARIKINIERPEFSAISIDEPEEISVAITTSSKRPVHIVMRQVWPDIIKERFSVVPGLCRPGETLKTRFEIRGIARGLRQVPPMYAYISIFGFSEKVVRVGEKTEIKVMPNLKAVRRLHRQLNSFALRGIGNRNAPRFGKGRNFDRLRDYSKDDDFRDIAWKASARNNKLIVREFRLDCAQDILICLDRGHMMATMTKRISRIDHAVNAAMLISYICNRMEDNVGVLSFGTEIEHGIYQGKGAVHSRRITDFVTSIRGEFIHTDYLVLGAYVRRHLMHRTLIVVMTALPEKDDKFPLLRMVKMLTPQHLPLIMILSESALSEMGSDMPKNKKELSRTLVARQVSLERKQMIEDLRRYGAIVIETSPQDMGINSVNAYIDVKRRQLI